MGTTDPLPPQLATAAPPLSSRRAFLRGVLGAAGAVVFAGGAAVAVAGCDPISGTEGEPVPPEFDALMRSTVALGNRYEAVMAAVPALQQQLTPVRDAHRAHSQALARAVGREVPQVSADGNAPPASRGQALAALRQAEKAGQEEAVTVCMAATARLAPLLGSIAAARASHLEVLT